VPRDSNLLAIFNIQEIFEKNSHSGRIKYVGPKFGKEKDTLFFTSDIFCLPSAYPVEALPLVLLEAMRAGLPIVTTDIGSIAEVVLNDLGGIVLNDNHPQKIIDALESLLKDHLRRKSFGDFNKDRFINYYSLDSFVRKWNKLLLS